MSAAQSDKKAILVLGLGELGTAIIDAFLSHPLYNPETQPLSVMIRPETIASPPAPRAVQLASLSSQGVSLVGGNIESSDITQLSKLFRPYHTVIHAGGMTIKPGTQYNVTKAVLNTGTNKLYIPWQFGVDYDVIGRQGGQSMFSEQLDIRDLLRSQTDVQWLIISCGVFMSFLFEDFWGVVVAATAAKGADNHTINDNDTNAKSTIQDKEKENDEVKGSNTTITKIRALGSWDDLLTATTAEDIGRCTAEVVLVSEKSTTSSSSLSSSFSSFSMSSPQQQQQQKSSPLRNQTIYISGDSMKYSEFADLIEQHENHNRQGSNDNNNNNNNKKDVIERELWTTDYLREESVKDPDNRLKKYQVVFSEGKGLAWPMNNTYNVRRGIPMTGIRDYLDKIRK